MRVFIPFLLFVVSACQSTSPIQQSVAGGGIGTGNPDVRDICNPVIDKKCELSNSKFSKVVEESGNGIQIFSVNNGKSDQEALNTNSSSHGNKADLLRRERIRQELANKEWVIRKIKEDQKPKVYQGDLEVVEVRVIEIKQPF
jgi:hypothetical protein